jgi:pantoate--beta-alanine ligase
VEGLSEPLCGAHRPGHFRGVCTVVAKLFNMVQPDVAVFGQKDAQQALVLRAMTEQLAFPVRLALAPTVREPDGLAASSRNEYLSPEERALAKELYRALLAGKGLLERGERSGRAVEEAVRRHLVEHGIDRIDYVELRDVDRLERAERAEGKVLLAGAVRIGSTRLIDNLVLEIRPDGEVIETMLF